MNRKKIIVAFFGCAALLSILFPPFSYILHDRFAGFGFLFTGPFEELDLPTHLHLKMLALELLFLAIATWVACYLATDK